MIALASGGFDPLHVGHVRMLKAAATYGRLTVALNSDAWLMRKKGYVFMPFDERREILESLSCVNMVLPVDDADGTVADLLDRFRPNFFCNGGDRETANEREHAVCEKYGIKEVFGVGGGKVQSSSFLVSRRSVSAP